MATSQKQAQEYLDRSPDLTEWLDKLDEFSLHNHLFRMENINFQDSWQSDQIREMNEDFNDKVKKINDLFFHWIKLDPRESNFDENLAEISQQVIELRSRIGEILQEFIDYDFLRS